MSLAELARIVWHWQYLVPQISKDYRYHRRVKALDASVLRRFAEQLSLLWTNRITAEDYYNLGLFDPSMTRAAKRTYLGGYRTSRVYLAFNPQEYHGLIDKKLEFNTYASEAGLPTAETLAVVTEQKCGFGLPSLATEEDLADWMVKNSIVDVVIKPVDGIKGFGVLSLGNRIGETLSWQRLPSGEPIDLSAIWTHCARYLYRGGVLVQRRLAPHPVLARVMPNVLHTVRVVTYYDTHATIIDAALRVGNGKGPADNLAQGAIVVPIDLTTGLCGRGSMLIDGLPHAVDHHPLTRTQLTGIVLPHWDQVCELAKAAAQTFSMQKSIGWDIGLTTQGPILLEGNWCYDLTVNQLARRQGILTTSWAAAFNKERAHRHLDLGFGGWAEAARWWKGARIHSVLVPNLLVHMPDILESTPAMLFA